MKNRFAEARKSLGAASMPLAKVNDGGLIRQIRSRHRRSVIILSDKLGFAKFSGKMKDQFCLEMFKLDRRFENCKRNSEKSKPVTLTN